MEKTYSVKGEHILACGKLYVEVFNGAPWNDEWTMDTACKRLNDIFVSPGFRGVVYIEDGEVLGGAFGNLEQYYNGLHYNLRELFVKESAQRKGIGSLMLSALEEELKGENLTSIILFTSKGNGTFEFYERAGFKEFDEMIMMGK